MATNSINHATPEDWDNLYKIGHAPKCYVVPGNQYQEVQKPANLVSPSTTQVGGTHYQVAIQPVDYCLANDLDFLQSNVIKYVTRHKNKGKAEDIHKAIHYCQLILEKQYGNN